MAQAFVTNSQWFRPASLCVADHKIISQRERVIDRLPIDSRQSCVFALAKPALRAVKAALRWFHSSAG